MNILTLNKIAACGTDLFDKAKYTVGDAVEEPVGILVRSAAMHDMELPESVLAIGRAGAGTNNIPVDACAEKGIVVFNTPGANANAVKELVLCGLLLASRKVVSGIEWAKSLKPEGDAVAKLVEKGKGQFVGPEILGKKLGVIGLGAIGGMVANAADALGMQVYGYDPYMSVQAAWGLNPSIHQVSDMNEIFTTCDYISLHVPCLDSTKGMINAETIGMMKTGVRILNFARGELVNNADMIAALETGKVARYVTDFPNADLLDVVGVVPLPHLGASTPESEDNCAVMASKELIDYIENGNIVNSVNYPSVAGPRSTVTRVCVMHRNLPGLISQISGVMSDNGINVESMLNRSRKEYAYSVLDVDAVVPQEALTALSAIEGVIRVRAIV
ncbi:MAG: phosphoglycerate dehydrogenase [Clostridia bacterium]|nr:phosphoglycerate dehydrogenase [Clostridia bacterium]